MSITTTPTQAMEDALADEFSDQFDVDPPLKTPADIKAAMGKVIAKAIELTLIEVKNNAEVNDLEEPPNIIGDVI